MATGNQGKLAEARAILSEYQIEVRQVPSHKVEIQSSDLSEIASFAADHISRVHAGMVAVEDSGLFVSSLSSFPGPFTAYVHKTIGISGILRLLENSSDRRAEFRAAIAVSRSGHTLRTFSGNVRGRIARSPRGKNGFGFDPIFIPKGHDRTFAEMDDREKNRHSHRRRGLRNLARWYSKL